MNIERAARRRFWRMSLLPRLPIVGQLAALIVVATALLLPAPFLPNQLPAARPDSDLTISHWPTALLIQRTFAQEHRLPLWNPYFGGGEPLAADPLAALFYPPTHLVHFLSLRNYYLVLIIGHLVFAGWGMLLLARRAVGLPRFPALVAAGVIGVLLAAVHLLPLMEFTALSTRQLSVRSTDAYRLQNFLYALIDQQPARGFSWEVMVTPGLAVLILALFAVATRWRKTW